MNVRITLISHAATDAQRHAAFPADEPITERERMRISRITWTAPNADRIWCAPEQRTQLTCNQLGLSGFPAEALRDCDYGKWAGRRMEEIQAKDADGLLAWLTNPTSAPHGGESVAHLVARAEGWLAEQTSVGHVIALTHPSVIRAVIVSALHLSPDLFWRFDIAPLTVTDVRFNGHAWTLRCSGCPLSSDPSPSLVNEADF